tara:strand:+ start:6524 stop:7102 length:579 start_codon:yes stop_codon:yes gene_type:complete
MLIAGVDEVGRGPLAGPVFAAAVILGKKRIIGLSDSKSLSPKELIRLDKEIRANAIAFSIGKSSVTEIETLNILHASLLAMKRAIKSLSCRPSKLLIDGNIAPSTDLPLEMIIKGDTKIHSIMAASVVAKVARDELMKKLDKKFPIYDFKNNKGYPTRFHLKALKEFGPCKHHRMTFKPLKKLDNEVNELKY